MTQNSKPQEKKHQPQLCKFYLVRHGQTEWNQQKILQGHLDSPLTKTGKNQAKQTAQTLTGVKFDLVFSSDLLRAKKTAEIIAANKDLAVKTSKLLRETSMGPYEGQPLEKFRQELRDAIEHRESLPQDKRLTFNIHPEIDTFDKVAMNLLTFLREVALAHPGKTVLIVSHAGTIRASLIKLGYATWDEMPFNAIKNTGYAVLDSDGVDFFVRETQGVEFNR